MSIITHLVPNQSRSQFSTVCHGKSVEYISIHYWTNFSPLNSSILFGFGFRIEFDFDFNLEFEFEVVRSCHREFLELLLHFLLPWFLYSIEFNDYILFYNRTNFSVLQSLKSEQGCQWLHSRNNKLEQNILFPNSCGRATMNPLNKLVISNFIGSWTYFSL